MRFILTALIFVMLAGSFQSCVSKKKFDELQASKDATDQALAETQAEVKSLEEQNEELAAEMAAEKERLNGELNNLRTDMTTQMGELNEKLSMTEGELKAIKDEINGMFNTYQESGLTMEERDGRLYLVTEEPVTFRSSSSSLTRDQRNAIDAMAEKLKGTDIKIMVEGYTDDRKFASGSGTDNWDLSFRRAKAVAGRLIRQGVDASQVSIAGYGETMPVGDNGTADGRKMNRRTAVTPNPDLGGLMKPAGVKTATMEDEDDDMDDDGDDN